VVDVNDVVADLEVAEIRDERRVARALLAPSGPSAPSTLAADSS
jgi:hypothetical protein